MCDITYPISEYMIKIKSKTTLYMLSIKIVLLIFDTNRYADHYISASQSVKQV